tara:strand:- start:13733 stop:14209 length:477 start_codon:yes stop_codon:yes gene_type:complete
MGCQLFLIVLAIIAGLCVSGLRRSIKQSDEQTPVGKSATRWVGTWAFVVVLATLTIAWNWSCFSTQKVYLSLSPDAAWKLVVEQRCAFPRSELVDPAATLGFRLVETKTGKTLAYKTARLEEESDYQAPDVTWKHDLVQVANFDDRKPSRLDLVIPPN